MFAAKEDWPAYDILLKEINQVDCCVLVYGVINSDIQIAVNDCSCIDPCVADVAIENVSIKDIAVVDTCIGFTSINIYCLICSLG